MPRPLSRLRRTRRPLLALVALVVALVVGYAVHAGTGQSGGAPALRPSVAPTAVAGSAAGLSTVALSSLPAQAGQTLELIRAGGPYPYPHNDGVVFHNEEHRLPRHADGWFHEYTVPTPGSATRGARRLIVGRDGAVFYTGDHYDTFALVDPSR